ncbi:MAG TPA: hypothetical protein VGF58_17165 [Burkholderiales bacterium]|jgi:hypothetical protein
MTARLGAVRALLAAACIAIPPDAAAQEIFGLFGALQADTPEDGRASAWLISYHQPLGEHLAASFTYQNEGHVPNHHRDGQSLQLWAKTTAFSPQLSFAAGAGPYRYYDTTVATGASTSDYTNAHGYGVLYSAAATWSATGRWLYQVRLDHVETKKSIDTTELVFGVGYKLDKDDESVYRGSDSRPAAKRDELTLFAGESIVNSLGSENDHAVAASIEYRHAFGPAFRGSIAWLHEGNASLVGRYGIVTQGWYEPSFFGDRFTLGVGLGAYVAVDEQREGDHDAFAAGILTMTGSYRIGREWTARFSWSRVLSNYDRDSDVLLFGVGYRF